MIVIWAEGGERIGSGHLNRSVDIFNILKGEFPVNFYAEDQESIQFYKDRGIYVLKYDVLKKGSFFLITDLRFPEEHKNLKEIKKNVPKHLSIHDMGLAQINSDIKIDGHIKMISDYHLENNKKYFLGPEYFLLKTKFRHFNKAIKKIKKKARRIYLSLGGWSRLEDLRYFTELLLKEGYVLTISWGFGKSNRDRRLFRKNFPSVHIVTRGEFIPRKYYEADIAILAGGISFYEAACTGTPSLLFYKDEFQKFTVESFVEKGFGISAGNLYNFNTNEFLEILRNYRYDFEMRKNHSNVGKRIVDGLGLLRLKKIVEKEYDKLFK